MSASDIIHRLKQLRAEAALSQDKLAKKIGVSSGNVSSWESGNALPGALALKSIRENLGCSIDWLLTGEGSAPDFPPASADPRRKELLQLFDQLPPEAQSVLLDTAKTILQQSTIDVS